MYKVIGGEIIRTFKLKKDAIRFALGVHNQTGERTYVVDIHGFVVFDTTVVI